MHCLLILDVAAVSVKGDSGRKRCFVRNKCPVGRGCTAKISVSLLDFIGCRRGSSSTNSVVLLNFDITKLLQLS